MKNTLILLLCICCSGILVAQQSRSAFCNYALLLEQGQAFVKNKDYDKALLKFNSARRCDPSKGEEIDAEIDLVFKRIKAQRDLADSLRIVAQQERIKTEKTLIDLKSTTEEVVRLVLKDAEKLILNLDYAGAWIKLRAAGRLKALTREVALALLEPAFWHAEAGHYTLAAAMLDTITGPGLLNNSSVRTLLRQLPQLDSTAKRLHLWKCILMLDKVTYEKYQQRYYPVMVRVPGDEFMMGDVMGDSDSTTHPVRLSDFEMASTETTVWQWSIFCATTGRDIKKEFLVPNWNEPGDNPVVKVDWYNAVAYANWLNARYWLSAKSILDSAITGDAEKGDQLNLKAPGFRLPTEAEWEYAARGGGKIVRFGNDKDIADPKEINFDPDENSKRPYSMLGVYRERTSAVGSLKSPNALGLHDMSGNVWEWCWDWYKEAYPSELSKDYTGPESGDYRVLRGGSWSSGAEVCRVAYRNYNDPFYARDPYGFRLARTF